MGQNCEDCEYRRYSVGGAAALQFLIKLLFTFFEHTACNCFILAVI